MCVRFRCLGWFDLAVVFGFGWLVLFAMGFGLGCMGCTFYVCSGTTVCFGLCLICGCLHLPYCFGTCWICCFEFDFMFLDFYFCFIDLVGCYSYCSLFFGTMTLWFDFDVGFVWDLCYFGLVCYGLWF